MCLNVCSIYRIMARVSSESVHSQRKFGSFGTLHPPVMWVRVVVCLCLHPISRTPPFPVRNNFRRMRHKLQQSATRDAETAQTSDMRAATNLQNSRFSWCIWRMKTAGTFARNLFLRRCPRPSPTPGCPCALASPLLSRRARAGVPLPTPATASAS